LFDVVGKRYWYFLLSLVIIIPGTLSLIFNGLRLGTDFTGGTEVTLNIAPANQAPQIRALTQRILGNVDYVQPIVSRVPGEYQYLVRMKSITPVQYKDYKAAVAKTFPGKGAVTEYTVSGTIAASLTQQAIIAVVVAAVAILLYISLVFRQSPHPFRFGTAAVVAMLHDVLVVLGIFSILGAVAKVEVDAPFVTAMLTIIGFSVHDTIVIFDRIRENLGRRTGERFDTIVNHSILQSFVRSINTSFTVVLALLAVFLFTGASIRYFVLAMLIGIISGTYSSIFNASQILVVWENHEVRKLLHRGGTSPAKAA